MTKAEPPVKVAPVVTLAPVVTPKPVVAPEVPQGPPIPADGHAAVVQLFFGPEPTDGSGRWTRFDLVVVDATKNEVAAATTGRLDAPCNEVPLETGDLGRWVCWAGGGGYNVRLVSDADRVVLRTQVTDEGLRKPAPWTDMVVLALAHSAGVVLHRRPDSKVDEVAATPKAAAAEASPVDVEVQLAKAGARTTATLRVLDGKDTLVAVTSPGFAGTPGPQEAADLEALASWSLGAGDGGALRAIQSGRRVVLQRRPGGAAGWEDVVSASLPSGRAAQLRVKK